MSIYKKDDNNISYSLLCSNANRSEISEENLIPVERNFIPLQNHRSSSSSVIQ